MDQNGNRWASGEHLVVLEVVPYCPLVVPSCPGHPLLSQACNCPKFIAISLPTIAKVCNCPKNLEILIVNPPKVCNCPKKPKKPNISQVLAEALGTAVLRPLRY